MRRFIPFRAIRARNLVQRGCSSCRGKSIGCIEMLRWKSRNFAVTIGELEENGWILEEEDSFVDRGLFQE